MQALLGIETPGRGGLKREHLGVWGLLWVGQGETLEPLLLEKPARQSLEAVLAKEEIAAATGGNRTQHVIDAAQTALGKFLTAGQGRPTGSYARVLHDVEKATAELAAAQADLDAMQQQLDGLAAMRRDLAAEERSADPEGEAAALAGLRQQLLAAERHAAEHASAKIATQLAENTLTSSTAALEDRTEKRDAASRLAQAKEQAGQAVAVAAANSRAMADALALAQQEHQEAAAQQALCADRAAAAEKAQAIEARIAQRRHQEQNVARALAAALQAEETRKSANAIALSDGDLRALRELAARKQQADAALQAAATKLRFTLTEAGSGEIAIDGQPVEPGALRSAVSPVEVQMGAFGSLRIEPGIQEGERFRRETQSTAAELQHHLAAAGVASVAEAEKLLERKRHLMNEGEKATGQSLALAPEWEGSVYSLKGALASIESEIQAASDQLAAIVDGATSSAAWSSEELAESLRLANAVVEAKADAMAHGREAAALSAQAHQHAQQRFAESSGAADAAASALAAARSVSSDEILAAAVELARLQVADARNALASSERLFESSPTPARLNADIERRERAASERQKRTAQLREGIARLEAAINAQAADGPQERVTGAAIRLENATVERDRMQRDIDALQLLLQLTSAAQSAAEAQFMAPVTKKMGAYLEELFGNSEIELNRDFSLANLRRAGRSEPVQQLSAGTQEQLAVLARLAFAEVLAEKEHPITLVLDDALAFADDRRIHDMFSSIERLAGSVQVLVFSCRQRAFDGLGGAAQRRLSLEECSPIEV